MTDKQRGEQRAGSRPHALRWAMPTGSRRALMAPWAGSTAATGRWVGTSSAGVRVPPPGWLWLAGCHTRLSRLGRGQAQPLAPHPTHRLVAALHFRHSHRRHKVEGQRGGKAAHQQACSGGRQGRRVSRPGQRGAERADVSSVEGREAVKRSTQQRMHAHDSQSQQDACMYQAGASGAAACCCPLPARCKRRGWGHPDAPE